MVPTRSAERHRPLNFRLAASGSSFRLAETSSWPTTANRPTPSGWPRPTALLEVEPVQPLENSLGDRRVFALALKGPRITRIAAADTRTGRWYAHDLKEPATGELRPLFVAGGASLYHVGRSLYYFNGQTGNPHWIVVEPPAGVTAKPTRDKVGRIHVEGEAIFSL